MRLVRSEEAFVLLPIAAGRWNSSVGHTDNKASCMASMEKYCPGNDCSHGGIRSVYLGQRRLLLTHSRRSSKDSDRETN